MNILFIYLNKDKHQATRDMMSIAFDDFFKRLCSATDLRSQMDLARALGLNRSAITQAKIRDAVPQKWILALARRYSLSPDWLEFGTGTPRPQRSREEGNQFRSSHARPQVVAGGGIAGQVVRSAAQNPLPHSSPTGEDLVYIPKSAARLCAGGGSFEVDAAPVAIYPLPRVWLNTLGKPSSMVFMDVVGDSMEPGIYDGDMVLVDTSRKDLHPASILAVSFDNAIYLKRVQRESHGLSMHSDNPAYGPVTLQGDELDCFHVIGRMIWLCRNYR